MSEIIHPILGADVYIAPTAFVAGDVVIGDQCTIMHHVVIRGDVASIRIGNRVNIQDGSVVHTQTGVPLVMGDDIGVGHRAVVHCSRVGNRTLIGIGAVVLDDCVIGSCCLIAAGSLLPPRMVVPDGKLVMGAPARIVRDITEKDLEVIDHVVRNYVRLGRDYANGRYPNIAGP
ncbi:MAG: gamma carbonic anhydrase family protein [Planctomycetota bacterium]